MNEREAEIQKIKQDFGWDLSQSIAPHYERNKYFFEADAEKILASLTTAREDLDGLLSNDTAEWKSAAFQKIKKLQSELEEARRELSMTNREVDLFQDTIQEMRADFATIRDYIQMREGSENYYLLKTAWKHCLEIPIGEAPPPEALTPPSEAGKNEAQKADARIQKAIKEAGQSYDQSKGQGGDGG